jgi:hypothetical protein
MAKKKMLFNLGSFKALLVIVLALVGPTAAFADQLVWTITPSSGSLSYGGGTGALVGTNIGITSVQDGGTILNISGGSLNFTTGSGTAGAWSWGAAPAGTLTLTGSINGGPNGVLFSDEFTSASILSLGGLQLQLGGLVGTLSSTLANDLGVSTIVSSAADSIFVSITGAVGSSFDVRALSGQINTTSAANPVTAPEPASLLLLISGLAVVAGMKAKADRLLA